MFSPKERAETSVEDRASSPLLPFAQRQRLKESREKQALDELNDLLEQEAVCFRQHTGAHLIRFRADIGHLLHAGQEACL